MYITHTFCRVFSLKSSAGFPLHSDSNNQSIAACTPQLFTAANLSVKKPSAGPYLKDTVQRGCEEDYGFYMYNRNNGLKA